MTPAALDAILLEEAAHRRGTQGDATLQVNQLAELLESAGRLRSDECSQVVRGEVMSDRVERQIAGGSANDGVTVRLFAKSDDLFPGTDFDALAEWH